VNILGVDPGLLATGYGAIRTAGAASKLIEAGVISTVTSDPLERRILKIYHEIKQIMLEFEPGAVAVEDLYSHYDHPMTATLMGHARGVMFLAAAELEIDVFSYASTRLKKALTGNGKAGKTQVQRMVQKMLGITGTFQPDHVTDALAAALCHANVWSRHGVLGRLSSGAGRI
jgi:crossover junction endodeoxyribonuclease RuvC